MPLGRIFSALLASLTWAATGLAAVDAPVHVGASLNFGDFISKAEWTYPAHVPHQLSAVLLLSGSGPTDLNATVTEPDGRVLSRNFALIAQALAEHGIATLRYNEHYLTAPGQVAAPQKIAKSIGLPLLVEDADTALLAMEHNPRIDPQRIFVYGWSEGSVVGAALLRRHPEVAGFIVQGSVLVSNRRLATLQFENVQLPFLQRAAPHGLTLWNLSDVQSAAGSHLAHQIMNGQLLDGTGALNMNWDTNHDGALQLDSEVRPAVLQELAALPQNFPTVTDQIRFLKMPLLVLQGVNDANTPNSELPVLERALHTSGRRATIDIYPGLGHSLGPARDLQDDNFRPMTAQPINDLVSWILHQSLVKKTGR